MAALWCCRLGMFVLDLGWGGFYCLVAVYGLHGRCVVGFVLRGLFGWFDCSGFGDLRFARCCVVWFLIVDVPVFDLVVVGVVCL